MPLAKSAAGRLDICDAFEFVDPVSLASASIAQVRPKKSYDLAPVTSLKCAGRIAIRVQEAPQALKRLEP